MCKAECCSTMVFRKPDRVQRGSICKVKIKGTPAEIEDRKWYYKIHGLKIDGACVVFRLVDFKVDRDRIILRRKCKKLFDGKCIGHPEKKPKVCRDLVLETAEDSRFFITKNCLFKYQLKVKESGSSGST